MNKEFDIRRLLENTKSKVKVVQDPEKYDKAVRNHPFYKEAANYIINEIESSVSNPLILELGFGTGTFTESLLKMKFKKIIAIDPEKADFVYGIKKFENKVKNLELINADLKGFCHFLIKIKPETKFDIITSMFVDHHIPFGRKTGYYATINNLLTEGGFYIAGEELIRKYSNETERIRALKEYHGYIIQECVKNKFYEMAEIETQALRNGIDLWDEYKVSLNKYKRYVKGGGLELVKLEKIGPEELKEAGIYVLVAKGGKYGK